MAPQVSTIIPCFNGAAFVGRAIASALSQEGVDVEVIVVDDGSTDGSAARLRPLVAREPRLRLHELGTNQGAAEARNAGMRLATGRYLAFLDADDGWRPRKLARQIDALQARGAALAYTGVEVRDAQGRTLARRRVPRRVSAEQLLVHNVIATSSVLIDRTRVAPFRMPPLRLRQDLATWHALLSRGVVAAGIDEALTIRTVHDASLSANKLAAAHANWRLYREHLARPLPNALSLFARYAAAALVRT